MIKDLSTVKVGVIGRGYVGNALLLYLNDRKIDARLIERGQKPEVAAMRYDVVVNAAGHVGINNLEDVQEHYSELKESNVEMPQSYAEACSKTGSRFIHMSSGCVYSGYKGFDSLQPNPEILGSEGWVESDPTNSDGNSYIISKISAEETLQGFKNVTILRPRMIFDETSSPKNLLLKLIKYNQDVLVDGFNSITSMNMICECVASILKEFPNPMYDETYHINYLFPITSSEICGIIQSVIPSFNVTDNWIDADTFNARNDVKRSFTTLNSQKMLAHELYSSGELDAVDEIVRCLHILKKNKSFRDFASQYGVTP